MAKTPKLKTDPTSNPRSRASRRAASSTSFLPANKTLESLSRASDATPVLAVPPHKQPGGRVTKTKKKPKTRAQRLRQEKGLARAEDVLGKLERKSQGSVEKGRRERERRRGWEEVNADGDGVSGKGKKRGNGLGKKGAGGAVGGWEMEAEGENGWEDEVEGGEGRKGAKERPMVIAIPDAEIHFPKTKTNTGESTAEADESESEEDEIT